MKKQKLLLNLIFSNTNNMSIILYLNHILYDLGTSTTFYTRNTLLHFVAYHVILNIKREQSE